MEIKTNEMEIVKKSFWKSKAFWIVSIIVFLISAYYIGKSNNVPKGIDSNFYNESVHAFEKYNEIFDDGKFPSNGFIPDDKDVKTWLATNTMNYSINPNDYTKKEARIIVLFNTIRENLKMLQQLGEGEGFKIQISEAWSELADILEIYSNSPLNNAAINQEESIVTEEATLDSTNADLENETNNFLDNNEDINTTNEFGITKLAKASGEGNITLVKNLLSQGADPNLCRDMGEPPLLWAIRANNDEIVKILLDAGANPNYKSNEGMTPLIIAQENGANVILKYLEEFRAKQFSGE